MPPYKKPLYDVPHITDLRDLLRQSAAKYGDKDLFLDRKDNEPYYGISYRRYYDDVRAFGAALLNLGLKDKKIAVIGSHTYEWSVAYMAVVCGLGVVVPVDKELPLPEMARCLGRAQVAAVVFAKEVSENVLAIKDEISPHAYCYINMDAEADDADALGFANLLAKGHKLLSNNGGGYDDLPVNPEELSVLLFTSGTSSSSKAVMLSHKNICSNITAVGKMVLFNQTDVFLSVLPIHHTYQCTCGFLLPMLRGAVIAFCPNPKNFGKNLAASQTTILLGVPLIFESLHKYLYTAVNNKGKTKALRRIIRLNNVLRRFKLDLSRVFFRELHKGLGGKIRLFISGAAGIDPKISKSLRNIGIPILQGYGLTECSPIVTVNRESEFRDSAAGLPLPGLSVKILKPDADGIGEIAVKGDSVMLGYYQQPKKTEMVFNSEGYFLTGDLGYMDKHGFFYITGRKRNVIVTKNGKTVFPEELEELLMRSPYIKECMVYAKPKEKGPDDAYHSDDDVNIAVSIVPDMDYIMSRTGVVEILSESSIKLLLQSEVNFVNRQVSHWKHIRHLHVRQREFIKSSTFKIKRYLESPEEPGINIK